MFKKFGCKIPHEEEEAITSKISKSLQILGTVNNVLKQNLFQRQYRLRGYNFLAIPLLVYGCQIWVMKQTSVIRLKMTLMRRAAEYSLLLDHREQRYFIRN
jgi:hypothetical protein